MDRDGTEDGYELELTRAVADAVDVPVIASGGAGTLDHLVEAVERGRRRRRARAPRSSTTASTPCARPRSGCERPGSRSGSDGRIARRTPTCASACGACPAWSGCCPRSRGCRPPTWWAAPCATCCCGGDAGRPRPRGRGRRALGGAHARRAARRRGARARALRHGDVIVPEPDRSTSPRTRARGVRRAGRAAARDAGLARGGPRAGATSRSTRWRSGSTGDDLGHLYDPHGGLGDLEARAIRVLHDRSFLDDPTRLLRAVRYETRLGFALDPETERLAREAVAGGRARARSRARASATS